MTATSIVDGHWSESAACDGVDPGIMFPAKGRGTATAAKAICATCPVVEPCLEYALTFPDHDDFGVWGGTTVLERRSIRDDRRHQQRIAQRRPGSVVAHTSSALRSTRVEDGEVRGTTGQMEGPYSARFPSVQSGTNPASARAVVPTPPQRRGRVPARPG